MKIVFQNLRPTTVVLNLAGRINTAEPHIVNVTPHKVELSIAKLDVGQKWGTWGTQSLLPSTGSHTAEGLVSDHAATSSSVFRGGEVTAGDVGKRPVSQKGSQGESTVKPEKMTEAPLSATASKAKPTGPPAYPTSSKSGPKNWEHLEDDEEEDKKDINSFFQELYAGSSPEQQRAMLKSFTESNGTALSTDWSDVKDRTVDVHPPEGVEAKKW